ncbi:PREDICTED: uncharacterized protein LOC106806813 [Priapulus caudatus]|uniref:Uncharacterized protein LOC106806813 n=1 Tax=Priapulus caudatus TaxID=37621 RepID=A0ABM1DWT0_PRICU|nr:PREDICTED: uncharacterized protein LOC106806813 [Priapulus caudatus]
MATAAGLPRKMRKCDGENSVNVPEFREKQVHHSESDGVVSKQDILKWIDSCQSEIDNLNERCSEEVLKIEQRYSLLKKPIFCKRNEFIEKIPNFWSTTFLNHPQISVIVDEDEEECIRCLKKVEVEDYDDLRSGYRIRLHFEENPFFENMTVCKEFASAHATYDPSSGIPEIRWKDGKSLAECQEEREGRKRDRRSRTFFMWLTSQSDAASDVLAEAIKDEIWPNPLQYFVVDDAEESEQNDATERLQETGGAAQEEDETEVCATDRDEELNAEVEEEGQIQETEDTGGGGEADERMDEEGTLREKPRGGRTEHWPSDGAAAVQSRAVCKRDAHGRPRARQQQQQQQGPPLPPGARLGAASAERKVEEGAPPFKQEERVSAAAADGKQDLMLSLLYEIREEQWRARGERARMAHALDRVCGVLHPHASPPPPPPAPPDDDDVSAPPYDAMDGFRVCEPAAAFAAGDAVATVAIPGPSGGGGGDDDSAQNCIVYKVEEDDAVVIDDDDEDENDYGPIAELYDGGVNDAAAEAARLVCSLEDPVARLRHRGAITYGSKPEPEEQRVFKMFQDTRNAKLFALKLLGAFFTKRELALSNLYGGKVHTGKMWAEKRALEPARMRRVFTYLEQYYPGCRDRRRDEAYIRDAINNKCRNSLRWIRENPLLDD